jgi:hypothetical protein
MNPVSLGLLIASALWMLLPQAVAAQCEGGTSTAGYYLRDGSYVPGGCAYTNSTTAGQMHPSGAQPLPSTNPVAGASALPGQRVATGSLPVTAGDLGQPLGAVGGLPQNLGPGAPGGLVVTAYPGTGLAASGLATTGNGVGTSGLVNGITGTQGLPPTTSTSVISGISGAPNVVLPGGQLGAGLLLRDTAYGYSLPAAPPVSEQAASPTAPDASQPPPPGRGGPTFIGEEGRDGTIITLPNR